MESLENHQNKVFVVISTIDCISPNKNSIIFTVFTFFSLIMQYI